MQMEFVYFPEFMVILKWLQGHSSEHGQILWEVVTLRLQLHLPVHASYAKLMVGFWNKSGRDGERQRQDEGKVRNNGYHEKEFGQND